MSSSWGEGGPRGENVFVFHLSYELDNEAVKVALQCFGPVHSVRHQHHPHTSIHTGTHIVHMIRGAHIPVVIEMVILAQSSNSQNCIEKTNKIPEYARDFKNEYLFIRGINKELDDFTNQYLSDCSELFVSGYSDRINLFIKIFLKAQELNYLKDTSCFIFKECDVENIIFLFDRMYFDFEDDEFVDGHPDDYQGYRDFYELFCKFYDKINTD